MRIKSLILFTFCLLALVGCKEGLTSHNITLNGVDHGKKLYKGAKDCTACHGVNLQGQAYIPGCFSCHGVMWNKDDHKVNRGGVMHKSGYFNAEKNCAACHGGPTLKKENIHGKLRPGCYDCHGDKWSALKIHSVSKAGSMHAEDPFAPNPTCSECHGTDLKGSGGAPSCYSCHGARWLQADSPHTQSKGGKKHAPNFGDPDRYCAACHGTDLKGSDTAPSCYSCHGAKWLLSGTPHTVMKYGYAHAEAFNSPQNNCTGCHGADLRGSASAPSCYQCHGAKWSGGGDKWGGIAPIKAPSATSAP